MRFWVVKILRYKIGLILKIRDVKIWSSFFSMFGKKMRKIDLQNWTVNWDQLEQFKNLTYLISNLAILEIQDRFKNYYLQKFTKKKWWAEFYIPLSFKISPILPKNFWDPETHNLTEVWTQLKKRRLCPIFTSLGDGHTFPLNSKYSDLENHFESTSTSDLTP